MQTLARIPKVELWELKGENARFLEKSEWTIININNIVTSKIGEIEWQLNKSLYVLKPEFNNYLFNINHETKTYYCVKLPEDVDPEELQVLEVILEELTSYKIKQSGTRDISKASTSDKVVSGIGTATGYIVSGLQVGTQYLNKAITYGTEKFKEKYDSCKEPKEVSEKTKNRIKKVKEIAKMASQLSSAVVNAITDATSKIADLIIGTSKEDEKSGKEPGSVKKVAAAVVISAAEIYTEMENSFVSVAKNSAQATTEMVKHKYGNEMGDAVYDGLSVAGHSTDAVLKVRKLGVKTIVKSTAKKTAYGYVTKDVEVSHIAENK